MPKAKKKIKVRDQSPLKDPKGGKGGKKGKSKFVDPDGGPPDPVVLPPHTYPQ
jgi:hypothetical protein